MLSALLFLTARRRNLCVCAISAAREPKIFFSLFYCIFPLAAAASPKKDFCFLFGMNNWPLGLGCESFHKPINKNTHAKHSLRGSLIYLECIIYRLRLWNSIHAHGFCGLITGVLCRYLDFPSFILMWFFGINDVYSVFFLAVRSSAEWGKFDNVHVNFVERDENHLFLTRLVLHGD